jgi:hypothetical protein
MTIGAGGLGGIRLVSRIGRRDESRSSSILRHRCLLGGREIRLGGHGGGDIIHSSGISGVGVGGVGVIGITDRAH